MIRLALVCLVVCLASLPASFARAVEPIKVVIWDEQQPAQKKSYPEFLGNYIADYLKRQPGLEVASVSIDHPQKGLSKEVLDNCDVLVWWGHVRNSEVSEADAAPVVERIKAGKLSLLALHSAHWATPFIMAMHQRAIDDALATLTEEERATAPNRVRRFERTETARRRCRANAQGNLREARRRRDSDQDHQA